MAEYRENGGLRGHPIPLLSAEGELTIWWKPNGGKYSDLIFQFTNPILQGNVSGFTTNFRMPWKRALEFAKGLTDKEGIANMLERGEGVALGQRYGPVKLELNPLCYMLVYLTPEDARTIAHVVTEAVKDATAKKIR